MNNCLVIFVEGDTEIEFYKKVVARAKDLHPKGRFDTYIEYRNVQGIGGFKNIALRKFTKEIRPKYSKDCIFTVVLCSDTDVFEFAPKPPVVWKEVKSELLKNGATKVIQVQARKSIEDWFLYDLEGVLKYLRLGKVKNISGKNGYEKLQNLFKQAKKVYYKGVKSNGLIEKLNIDAITDAVKDQLFPLYKALGVKR